MNCRCPNCEAVIDFEKAKSRFFDSNNYPTITSGRYYQCAECKSLLEKNEHSIDKNIRLARPLVMGVSYNVLVWPQAFGYRPDNLYLIILMMFFVAFYFFAPTILKSFRKNIPSDWVCWKLYARAN